MNLSTNYMGFDLPHPLVPRASPLTDRLDDVKRLEDAGAPMIVMHSLFEEQIAREEIALNRSFDHSSESCAEALSYFPEPDDFALGPDNYLEQIRLIKTTVSVPVIASLNGVTPCGWIQYAKLIEEAGADGLEINLYEVVTDFDASATAVEDRLVEVVRTIREAVRIPLAVKLSPFFSSPGHFIKRIDELQVQGLVLFNRFYQPDLDIEELEVRRTVQLSDSSELLRRLRWLALLYGRVSAPLPSIRRKSCTGSNWAAGRTRSSLNPLDRKGNSSCQRERRPKANGRKNARKPRQNASCPTASGYNPT